MIRRAAHGRWFRRNHTLQQTEQPHGDAISNVVNVFAYEKLNPERHRGQKQRNPARSQTLLLSLL